MWQSRQMPKTEWAWAPVFPSFPSSPLKLGFELGQYRKGLTSRVNAATVNMYTEHFSLQGHQADPFCPC